MGKFWERPRLQNPDDEKVKNRHVSWLELFLILPLSLLLLRLLM